MTTTPSPEAFLAQPYDPDEEDAEPVDHAAAAPSLALISDALQAVVRLLERQESAVGHALLDERNDLVSQLDATLAQAAAQQAQIDEVLALCKPSTSKLANSIRAVLDPPEVAVVEESPAETEAAWEDGPSFAEVHAEVPDEAPAAAQQEPPSQAFELGPNASVEDWRAYARMFGHTEVDTLNRSQIRTLLGVPHPAEGGE